MSAAVETHILERLGEGVTFAAFAARDGEVVYKVPRALLPERRSFWQRLRSGDKPPVWTEQLAESVKSKAALLQAVPGHQAWVAGFSLLDDESLVLELGLPFAYRGFAIRQERVRPLPPRPCLADHPGLLESILEINEGLWSHGVGLYRHAEMLGFSNHGYATGGGLRVFDLDGVSGDLEYLCLRLGHASAKFRRRVTLLAQQLRSHNDEPAIEHFRDFCHQRYTVARVRELWRSATLARGEAGH